MKHLDLYVSAWPPPMARKWNDEKKTQLYCVSTTMKCRLSIGSLGFFSFVQSFFFLRRISFPFLFHFLVLGRVLCLCQTFCFRTNNLSQFVNATSTRIKFFFSLVTNKTWNANLQWCFGNKLKLAIFGWFIRISMLFTFLFNEFCLCVCVCWICNSLANTIRHRSVRAARAA